MLFDEQHLDQVQLMSASTALRDSECSQKPSGQSSYEEGENDWVFIADTTSSHGHEDIRPCEQQDTSAAYDQPAEIHLVHYSTGGKCAARFGLGGNAGDTSGMGPRTDEQISELEANLTRGRDQRGFLRLLVQVERNQCASCRSVAQASREKLFSCLYLEGEVKSVDGIGSDEIRRLRATVALDEAALSKCEAVLLAAERNLSQIESEVSEHEHLLFYGSASQAERVLSSTHISPQGAFDSESCTGTLVSRTTDAAMASHRRTHDWVAVLRERLAELDGEYSDLLESRRCPGSEDGIFDAELQSAEDLYLRRRFERVQELAQAEADAAVSREKYFATISASDLSTLNEEDC